MYNWERILSFLQGRPADSFCDDCLSNELKMRPRQQVYQNAERLAAERKISRGEGVCSACRRSKKVSWAQAISEGTPAATAAPRMAAEPGGASAEVGQSPSSFEELARRRFGEVLGGSFRPGSVQGVPKKFDLVDENKGLVGDAKYFTMVGGSRLPPAKFSVIAEHVWLLEKTGARQKFLVFGNDQRVPEEWLRRFGHLAVNVEFYFMTDAGEIKRLN